MFGPFLSALLLCLALEPAVVAPGELSGPADETAAAFSPDGRSVYLTRGSAIVVSHRTGKHWSPAALADFSGEWRDIEPAMSPDGSFLVFASNRPREGRTPLDGFWAGQAQPGRGGNLWKVTRVGSAWSAPVRLPDTINRSANVFAPAVAKDGTLYFMDQERGKFRLFRSAFAQGAYQTPEPLPFSAGEFGACDPAVSPDDSFLVFGSTRPPAQNMDLFLVFRDAKGWGEPIHLGREVNSAGNDTEPRLGPDGRTLYFSSDRAVPPVFPRTRAQARAHLARELSWENGGLNLWKIDLSPWLEAHRTSVAPR